MIRKIASAWLTIAGLAALTAAAWHISIAAGLAAAGAGLLILEWRLDQ